MPQSRSKPPRSSWRWLWIVLAMVALVLVFAFAGRVLLYLMPPI